MRYGALEAGGTKMVLAIGDENGVILEQKTIPTLTPEETVPQMISYFKEKMAEEPLEGIGVASFGPVDVREGSPSYGTILDTPKLAWKQYPLLATLKEQLHLPMGLDTDVNASCLGEVTYGSARGLADVVYYTIGTGIGGGIMSGGKMVHGMLHAEAGHVLMTPRKGDEGNCICPYHPNGCFEGLASGPSIEKRWGKKAIELADKAEVWELEAEYIAEALVNTIFMLSPRRIILGGGVMHQMQLFPLIRRKVQEKVNGYIRTKDLEAMDKYIVSASLMDDQGIMGCIRLAQLAAMAHDDEGENTWQM